MSLPAFGVRKPVPVNLLTVAILIAGTLAATWIRREFFPETQANQVSVGLIYPGATPEEIEQSLAIKVEDKLAELEREVDEMATTLSEGGGGIMITLREGQPPLQALDEIERNLKILRDLPDEAEEIRVRLVEPRLPVTQVAVYGDVDEWVLKRTLRIIKDDLRDLPGMGETLEQGVRPYEIRVDVDPTALFEHGISLPAIAQIIRNEMREVPGGTIRTEAGNIKVRTMGVLEQAERIAEIELLSDSSGRVVRLGDVATVRESFIDESILTRFNGYPASTLTIFKVGPQDIVRMAKNVRAYTDGRMGQPYKPYGLYDRAQVSMLGAWLNLAPTESFKAWQRGLDSPYPLPPGVSVTVYSDLARFVEDRLSLLVRNAGYGSILVFATLLFFLNWRVALWVGVGLVISIMGTLLMMGALDITLNLLTMFGLIVVLGLLVDDAIVVSENIQAHHDRGEPPLRAAVLGAEQVQWPVVATILTSIVAFLPLMLIKGHIGDLLGALPVVVACALFVSLIECLLILPSHMGYSLANRQRLKPTRVSGWIRGFERKRDHVLLNRIVPTYGRLLALALRQRYISTALAVAAVLISLGLVIGQRVNFTFLENNDAETVVVNVHLPIGSTVNTTNEVVERIESVARVHPEVIHVSSVVGQVANIEMGTAEAFAPHVAQMFIELTPTEKRPRRSSEMITDDIRQQLRGRLDDVERVSFLGISGGPGGADITIQIRGQDPQELTEASRRIQQLLAGYEGVHDINDNDDSGQFELRFELTAAARTLGLTRSDVATQLRAYLFGIDAHVFAAHREDIDVRVRLDEQTRRSLLSIREAWVVTPSGQSVPLSEVAEIDEASTYATIRRIDRRRALTVTADTAAWLSPENVTQAMTQPQTDAAGRRIGPSPLDEIRQAYPRLDIRFAGRQRQLVDAFSSLPLGFLAAILMIYVILAWLFSSYIQPLVVLAAVPFAIVGVPWGHLLLGYDITFLSLIGFVALSGIVVNDSLILVEFYNHDRRNGHDVFHALVNAGQARFRAILLTTLTTVLGLTPLMLEQSFQARFLIPMAIAIAFGLLSATVLILLILPCLILIGEDLKSVVYYAWYGQPRPVHDPVEDLADLQTIE